MCVEGRKTVWSVEIAMAHSDVFCACQEWNATTLDWNHVAHQFFACRETRRCQLDVASANCVGRGGTSVCGKCQHALARCMGISSLWRVNNA
jgi:hypothetical protein